MRWLIRFRDQEFFVNLDTILEPAFQRPYLEVKSRTWSRSDAEVKAGLIVDMLRLLGLDQAEAVADEYPDLALGRAPNATSQR